MNSTGINSIYNWTKSTCNCSTQCGNQNQTQFECCLDFDIHCLKGEKIRGTRFDALLQSLGLKHSHITYIVVGTMGFIIFILGFSVYLQKRKKPLTIKKICDNVSNGSLLEMTSSSESCSNHNHTNMMHWDEVYEEFIDFNLARTQIQPWNQSSLLSMCSNTVGVEDLNATTEQMEEINLEEASTELNGMPRNLQNR